jgi:hypothetical protein
MYTKKHFAVYFSIYKMWDSVRCKEMSGSMRSCVCKGPNCSPASTGLTFHVFSNNRWARNCLNLTLKCLVCIHELKVYLYRMFKIGLGRSWVGSALQQRPGSILGRTLSGGTLYWATTRETREGCTLPMLLLTLETEANGDPRSRYERGPSMVSSLRTLCWYKIFLSCLGCSSRPSRIYI